MVGNDESSVFEITRGTEQGDPISPPLFNAVLEKAVAWLKQTWIRRGWGVPLGVGKDERLLNLRFADDILLIAKSLKVLTKMMEEMQVAVREVGLEMHFGKTKILANAHGQKQGNASSIKVGANEVEIMSKIKVRSISDEHSHSLTTMTEKLSIGSLVDGLNSRSTKET